VDFASDDPSAGPMEGPITPAEYLAEVRNELGMIPRSVSPDDDQTLAIFFIDDQEYRGKNGGGKDIQIINPARPSATHAEIDAMNQAFIDRQKSGITGGSAVLYVDRPPCSAYCYTVHGKGAIPAAFARLGLDSLTVIYGEGYENVRRIGLALRGSGSFDLP
jgi:hypothetical protein